MDKEITVVDAAPKPDERVTSVLAAMVNGVLEKREAALIADIGEQITRLGTTPDRKLAGEVNTPQKVVERGNGSVLSRWQPTDSLYRTLLACEPQYKGVRDPDQDHWNIEWLRALKANDVMMMRMAEQKSNEAYCRANLLEGVLDASDPTALTSGSGSGLLPQSFAQAVEIAKGAAAVVGSLCTNFTATGNTLRVPTVTQVVAVQASEGAAVAEANPTVASVMMILTKTGARIILSDELVADSAFNVMTMITPNVGRGIGLKEDTMILQTDGTSPNITGALAGGAVSEATANSLYAVDLATLFFALGKAYQPQATWLAGPLVATILTNLTDGNGNQVLQQGGMPRGPVGDVNTSVSIGNIFGRPVYHVPAVAGDLIFGDLSGYGIVRKGGIEVKVSTEVGFASDTVQFKFTQRWDGQMLDAAAIKEIQGITTLGA
jgi:HK97 family phage major capsid protein